MQKITVGEGLSFYQIKHESSQALSQPRDKSQDKGYFADKQRYATSRALRKTLPSGKFEEMRHT